jgi:hypothetical protein
MLAVIKASTFSRIRSAFASRSVAAARAESAGVGAQLAKCVEALLKREFGTSTERGLSGRCTAALAGQSA